MAVFKYIALDEKRGRVRGVLDADTAQEARRKLRSQRVHVQRLTRMGAGTDNKSWTAAFSRRKTDSITIATKELATLLSAGIELIEALDVLLEQLNDSALNSVYRDIRDQVAQGNPLAMALKRHPRYFNDLYIQMVAVGEASGSLGQVMTTLADFLRKQQRGSSKLVSALIYPLVTMTFGGLVTFYLLVFFVPKMEKILLQHGKTLPLPTEILLATSNFMRTWWWAIPAASVTLIILLVQWMRIPSVKYRVHKFLLRIPILGELLKKNAVMRFSLTFSILLKSGVQVLNAINIAKGLVGNLVLVEILDKVARNISEGTDISQPLKQDNVFPPTVSHLIAVGEKTGQLEEMLDRVAADYEEEIDSASQRALSLVEPVMIVGLAGDSRVHHAGYFRADYEPQQDKLAVFGDAICEGTIENSSEDSLLSN